MSTLASVMVVDDEEELANLFMKLLKGSGFNSVSFTDPLLALKHFSQNPQKYSLVLLDLRMPGLNEIELAKRIKGYDFNVKILLITGFFDEEYIKSDELRESVISDVMQKPIKLRELKTHLNELCRVH
ncbi:MAG: response regulator [Candidatus Nitrosocosmicus sp.]|jgi:DNA-binding response OmpR family regulator|nr:hypothetical protein [Candidatus Nitrosocosmicus sp.]